MRLSNLFSGQEYELFGNDVDTKRLEFDSRFVESNDLFVCVVGTFDDGHRFAQMAVDKGAVALLVQRKLPIDIPQILVKNTRIAMAEAAAKIYDYPAKKLKIIGITGTNGKTTTTYMMKSIFEEAGFTVGLIGTITNLIGNEIVPSEHTTPESPDLHALLAYMVDMGVEVAVMEVSSHALDQHRVHGIEFDLAVFTNLTQDHLDYHKTMQAYFEAKKTMFKQAKAAVYNIDDEYGSKMIDDQNYTKISVGIRENADCWAKDIDITAEGVQFDCKLPGKEFIHISLNIPGLFSVYNSLLAAAVANFFDIRSIDIKRGLEKLKSVSGRIEPLDIGERDFTVLLDYAHTPDALENIVKTVRGFSVGRVVTMFGCGGGRDHAKRPLMGEIAGRGSDFCIVTSDNPRNEDPLDIINMIEDGLKKTACEYVVIVNRKEAIKYALTNAKKDDVVLLAGKGHETYQEIEGIKSHFDEKELVANIIKAMDEEGM